VLPPEGESIDTADERLLVEYTVAARNDYKIALSELYQFYLEKDRELKAEVVKRTAERLDFVRTYGYLAGAEIPPGDLAPVEVIPEADAMFTKATKLHFWGKLIPLLPDYRKQREALNLLTQLVRKYPKSTKIAFSAFYIGEIYKEYFNENLRAVRWYERAWTWDPTITKPARFQAAAVLDLRLNEKAKAVELYRQVIEKEQFNQSNVRFARERIQLLTQEPKPKR